jgi:hypothetical protein
VSPNPLTETGEGEVHAVIQVSTNPDLFGDAVNISSTSLDALCPGGVTYTSIAPGVTSPVVSADPITVILDGEGNATVMVDATQCAAGNAVVEADLVAAPYWSALTTLQILPPGDSAYGVNASPLAEIETGDTTGSGESDIYAVFNVEAPAVYAEQSVEIEASELVDRCGAGSYWVSNSGTSMTDGTAAGSSSTWTATLDDNGNATFDFFGASCASGTSDVLADVKAGLHNQYSTTFTVIDPRRGLP